MCEPIFSKTRFSRNSYNSNDTCTFKFQSVPSYSTLSSFSTIRFLTISSISAFLNLSLNKGSTDGCPNYQRIKALFPDQGDHGNVFPWNPASKEGRI